MIKKYVSGACKQQIKIRDSSGRLLSRCRTTHCWIYLLYFLCSRVGLSQRLGTRVLIRRRLLDLVWREWDYAIKHLWYFTWSQIVGISLRSQISGLLIMERVRMESLNDCRWTANRVYSIPSCQASSFACLSKCSIHVWTQAKSEKSAFSVGLEKRSRL